jgi:hypothetical protein
MRNSIVAAVVSLLVIVGVSAWAGDDSVTGEVVDLSCYLSHPATSTGSSHRKCAEMCAKHGLPMGILTEGGAVLLLVEDHGNPKAYADAIAKAAEKVTIDGRKVTEGGLSGLVVEAVK